MRRKISAFVCIFLICLSMIYNVPFTVKAYTCSGSCGENIFWTLDRFSTSSDATAVLKITGTGDMQDYTESLPAPWNEYAYDITVLKISEDVTSIGNYAFASLSDVAEVKIPNGVTEIGEYAFSGCSKLTSLTIPESVKIFGRYAFLNCTGLIDTYYEGTIESWCAITSGTVKFIQVTSNPLYYSQYFYINGELITDLAIPKGVPAITAAAFCGYKNLKSVVIPDSVTTMGTSVFYKCTGLTEVKISDNIKNIPKNTFYGCEKLTKIEIPDKVTSISEYAFYGCTGLKKITIPVSAKINNESNTFYGCENIEKVTITKGNGTAQNYSITTTASEKETYYRYTPWNQSSINLKEIIIEDGVNSIGDYMFYHTSYLKKITIPKTLTKIGDGAFKECKKIDTIHYVGTEKDWNSIVIGSDNEHLIDAPIKHFCPSESVIPTATTAGYRNRAVCDECNVVLLEGDILPATGFEPTNGMAIDFDSNVVYGLTSGITSLDDYTTLVNENYHWEYDSATLGTGTKATMTDGENAIAEYTILIYGDVNGDGWYDGEDAFIVNLMANGMLTEKNVGSLAWTAADCNHDGLIDENDIDLLVDAGLLLSEAKQNSEQYDLALNTEYIQYTLLIEQNAETSFATDTIIETNTEEIKSDSIFEIISTNLWNFIEWLIKTILSALV